MVFMFIQALLPYESKHIVYHKIVWKDVHFRNSSNVEHDTTLYSHHKLCN